MAVRLLSFAIVLLFIALPGSVTYAQQKEDTVIVKSNNGDTSIAIKDSAAKTKDTTVIAKKLRKGGLTAKDDSVINKYNPTGATIRSAIIPGWGQFYNKKYWKIPIVYAALGITAGVFFYNIKEYKLLRQAVIYRLDGIPSNDSLVAPELQPLSTPSLQAYRNEFRQNVDYSVLVFLLFWGLNVVDATVDAHLKTFDVSPNISMKIRPDFNYTSNVPGISLVFFFKDKSKLPGMPIP